MSLVKKIIFLLFLVGGTLSAQQIYFCKSFTEDGKPIEAKNEWKIEPWGSQVYILFDNEHKAIGDSLLYLFIDKKADNVFKPFDSQIIKINKNDKWAVFNYEFKDAGKYEVYFLNSSQTKLSVDTVDIQIDTEYSSSKVANSSRYYENCDLTFCEVVVNRKPVNVITSLSLSKNLGVVYVYLKNYMPFKTDTIKVQVWQDQDNDFEYEKIIGSKMYKLNPDWEDTFFKYVFSKPGKYQIKVFNQNDIFIASGQIEVVK